MTRKLTNNRVNTYNQDSPDENSVEEDLGTEEPNQRGSNEEGGGGASMDEIEEDNEEND